MSTISVRIRWQSLARLWPLTVISLGITISFFWAAFLTWLIVCAFAGLI